MKKFFSILVLFLFCSTWNSQAQQQTFNTPPKFKNVVQNDLNTKILSINSTTNKLEWVNKNSFVSPTPSFQDVLNVNNNALSYNGDSAFLINQGSNYSTQFSAETILFSDETINNNRRAWVGFDGFSSETNNGGKRVMLTTKDGLFLKTNVSGNYSSLKSDLITGTDKTFQFPNKSGTLAVTTDVPNNSYSTSEIVTGGTWIDGKPIYRKVIPGTTNSSGWWQMTGLGTSIFLKNFVSMNVLTLNGTTYQTIKSAVNNSGILIVIPSSIAGATPWIGVQSYTTSPSTPVSLSFVVILEYTKTTD